jgi:hypothetical protein
MSEWLRDYVKSPSLVDMTQKTWFGAPFKMRKGVPRLYTMCRAAEMDTEITSFLSSVFRSECADATITGAMCGLPTEYIEEPMFGIDEELPLQMFQYALERCISAGYLQGPEYYSPEDFDPSWVRQRIKARAHPVCEAGNKVRWVTMEEHFVTVALQVLSHWMAGIAQYIPNLWSAFKRSYKGWDFATSMMRWDGAVGPDSGLGTYDLKGASNNLSWEFCRMVGYELINHFAQDNFTRKTLFSLLDLALAPRLITIFSNEKDHTFRSEDPYAFRFETTNGLLMGNPGTKEFLVLTTSVCITATVNILRESCLSLVAGDDVGLLCTQHFFDTLIDVNVSLGNVIQTTKTLFSKRCVFFCEEVLDFIPASVGSKLAPWTCDYEAQSLHVDIIKLRLLSPFEGTQSQLLNPTYKNPAIGKAGALSKVLAWYPYKENAWVAKRRFTRWMSDFIRDDPLVYMPRMLGGHDIPFLGDLNDLYERILKEVPLDYIAIVENLRHNDDYHGLLDYLLRRMATGNSARGLFDANLYVMIGQFSAIAQILGKETRTFDSFREELENLKSYDIGFKDVSRFIKRSGFCSTGDIAEMVDRLTGIRLSFCAAEGTLPLDEYLVERVGKLPSPVDVLRQFAQLELPFQTRIGGFERGTLQVTGKDILSFRDFIVGGRWEFRKRRSQIYIPSSFVKDSLNGMRVPLPYSPPSRTVRGSVEDEFRNPDATGWIAHVVSLNRLKWGWT